MRPFTIGKSIPRGTCSQVVNAWFDIILG